MMPHNLATSCGYMIHSFIHSFFFNPVDQNALIRTCPSMLLMKYINENGINFNMCFVFSGVEM
jgi:hypothetical protein